MAIIIHKPIVEKLAKVHRVTAREVEQCFENMERGTLLDKREKHRTNPPTQWFISTTNQTRTLKVVFIQVAGDLVIKSAFEPNVEEMRIYTKHASLY